MLHVDVLRDESLSETLDKIISGLLPHEEYDGDMFIGIINKALSVIKLEEFKMEYYVIFSSLNQLRKIQKSAPNYRPTLTKEIFLSIVETNIYEVAIKPEVGLERWLRLEGLPSNLGIETDLEAGVQRLYRRCEDLYDRCYSLGISSMESMTLIPTLISNLISNLAESSLEIQREILMGNFRIGRKLYSGSQGWIDYMSTVSRQVSERSLEEDSVLHLRSIEQAEELQESLKSLYESFAEYGIPPLDQSISIMKHRLTVIAGNEGTGKTTWAISRSVMPLLLKNHRIVYMCGESPTEKIYAQICSNYIYNTKGNLQVTDQHIAGRLEVPDEIDKVIKISMSELTTSGNIILAKTFNYYTLYEDLEELYYKVKFDMIVIDHTKALRGGREEREDISALAVACREFKKNYPVHILVLSHLSSIAKEALGKGKEISGSPTRGSSTLSAEADEVYVLHTNNKLKKENLVAFDTYKTRSEPVKDVIMLKLRGNISHVEYDPRYQQGYDRNTVGAEIALKELEDAYDEDEDEDYE